MEGIACSARSRPHAYSFSPLPTSDNGIVRRGSREHEVLTEDRESQAKQVAPAQKTSVTDSAGAKLGPSETRSAGKDQGIRGSGPRSGGCREGDTVDVFCIPVGGVAAGVKEYVRGEVRGF